MTEAAAVVVGMNAGTTFTALMAAPAVPDDRETLRMPDLRRLYGCCRQSAQITLLSADQVLAHPARFPDAALQQIAVGRNALA